MKLICLLLCMFLCTYEPISVCQFDKSQSFTIVDYYKLLIKHHLIFDQFELKEQAGQWKTTSTAGYEMPVVVDVKNGFIEIYDTGTGGGSIKLQIVLYADKAGNHYIGVSDLRGNGVLNKSTYNFYMYENSKFREVSDELFREISLNVFFEKTLVSSNLFKLSTVILTLPRNGTTAFLNVDKASSQICCSYEFCKNDNIICSYLDNLKYTSVELLWNYNKGYFKAGKRTPC